MFRAGYQRAHAEGIKHVEKEELYARDITGAQWRKSSKSFWLCVEAAEIGDGAVALRDSENPGRADLRFTAEEWSAFRDGVRDGEFG
jgi:hypothetical protein